MASESIEQQLVDLKRENAALTERIAQLNRTENTLNAILKGTIAETGYDFFVSLVKHVATALQAKYALIGELVGPNKDQIKTIAFWNDGETGANFDYELSGSPCATVIAGGVQYYTHNTWKMFPEDKGLEKKHIECYIGAPMFDSMGEPLGVLVVMHDNVLEMGIDSVPIINLFAARAGAELARKRHEEKLRESERRYRHVVEQSNEVIYLAFNGRFELINERFCQLFEVTQAEVYAGQIRTIDLVAPESRSFLEQRGQLMRSGKAISERYEFVAQTKNGRKFPVEVSVSYVDYRHGTAVQGLLRDLTKRKHEESAERTQRELAEALHEIGLALSASLDIKIVLDLLLDQLGRVVPYDSATMIEVKHGQTFIVRARGFEKFGISLDTSTRPRAMDIAEALTWRTMIQTKRPLIIPDIEKSNLWRHSAANPHVRSWASAPVLIGGEVVAFLSVNKIQPDFYSEEYSNRLAAFAAQAALALQNASLFAAATERAEALRITGEILRALNAVSNIQDAFPTLVTYLKETTRCQRVTLAQLDENQESATFIALHDDFHELPVPFQLSASDSGAVNDLGNGRPHIVPNILDEQNYLAAQLLLKDGYHSYIALPLIANESVKGVLTLSWIDTNGFKDVDLSMIQQISSMVALGLERSQLFAKTQTRTQELNFLNKVISAAASGKRENEIVEIMCSEIANYLSVAHISLLELDDALVNGRVTAQYRNPAYASLVGKTIPLSLNSVIMTEILATKVPLVFPKIRETTFSKDIITLIDMYNLVSILLVPISLRGKVIGIMGIGSEEDRTFSVEEIRLMHTINEELGRILETARLYDQLRSHAAELEERVAERTSELADANEQLKELDALKSQFVTDVSHELRTPVTNLKLYLDLLEHKGADLLPKYLPILQKQADRLGQLIQDILDLSRLDMQQANQPLFMMVDLNAIIQDVILAHQPRAEVAGLRLVFTPDPNLPTIFGEHNQLAQVVTNLLANAINYTSEGQINVWTELTDNEKQVCLIVQDSGVGIHDDDLAYLFNRFYRGQKARQSNIPGTGLGLAIAHEIIRLHNGHIEVYSAVNKGSTFRVCLPIHRQSQTAVFDQT
ncbi:MAG: GAF domain-containing protein [Chloroflexi bacterium]|nr:GAF domain-containing protein [Chloroflexota bacterium]MBK8935816.1 GAF domain-containing protein [Chloroflexota bacterium]